MIFWPVDLLVLVFWSWYWSVGFGLGLDLLIVRTFGLLAFRSLSYGLGLSLGLGYVMACDYFDLFSFALRLAICSLPFSFLSCLVVVLSCHCLVL
jgi:hypothetical protein